MRDWFGSRSAIPLWVLLCSAWLGWSCASRTDQLSDVKRQIQNGNYGKACSTLNSLVEKGGARPYMLTVYRSWVGCHQHQGELDYVRAQLKSRPADGGVLYAKALLEAAENPAHFLTALKLLEKAALLWPKQAEIPYRCAILLLANHQPHQALSFIERAEKLEPSAAIATAKAHALLDIGHPRAALENIHNLFDLHPQKKDLQRGKALIKRLATRSRWLPPNARSLMQEAIRLLHQQNRPSACIMKLNEILIDYPKLGPVYTILGLAHLKLGNSADAIVALERAATLSPLDPQNPFLLAKIYQNLGRQDKCIDFYRRALDLDPFFPQATRALGELLTKQKRYREAAKILKRFETLEGGSTVSLRLAGRALYSSGELDQALGYYTRLYERDPRDFEVNLRLGQILLKRYQTEPSLPETDLEQAHAHASRATKLLPSDIEAQKLQQEIEQQLHSRNN